jgi:hypothetical protein
MALGSIHRASLLLSQSSDNDRSRGLDTKVIALHAYTRAIQQVSDQLENESQPMDILIAVLLLLAYFEVGCNFGMLSLTNLH